MIFFFFRWDPDIQETIIYNCNSKPTHWVGCGRASVILHTKCIHTHFFTTIIYFLITLSLLFLFLFSSTFSFHFFIFVLFIKKKCFFFSVKSLKLCVITYKISLPEFYVFFYGQAITFYYPLLNIKKIIFSLKWIIEKLTKTQEGNYSGPQGTKTRSLILWLKHYGTNLLILIWLYNPAVFKLPSKHFNRRRW